MKLSDYINYRNRGRKVKNTEYMLRTQRFYNGIKKQKDGEITGIYADFMNYLNIPSAEDIVRAQKMAFLALQKTKAQGNLLLQFNNSIRSDQIKELNSLIQSDIINLIHEFEEAIDNLKIKNNEYKNISKSDITSISALDNRLSQCYQNFIQVLQKIQKEETNEIIPELQELETNIKLLENFVKQNNKLNIGLFDNTALGLKTKEGKNSSFLSRLSYLSLNIKGVQLLEHRGLEFIREKLSSSLPEEIVIINSGQIRNSAGQQLSQDALMFDKNIKIKVKKDNNTFQEMTIIEYFNYLEKNSEKQTITIGDDELEQILSLALGIQSKYSRYGWITMKKNFSIEEIFKLQYDYARALRNLHILATGEYDKYKLRKNSKGERKKFNLKKSGKAVNDYNALFNYCLSSFMDKIISKNFFMLTADGLEDSQSFYTRLFNAGSYFRAKGNVEIANLNKKYTIQINSKLKS